MSRRCGMDRSEAISFIFFVLFSSLLYTDWLAGWLVSWLLYVPGSFAFSFLLTHYLDFLYLLSFSFACSLHSFFLWSSCVILFWDVCDCGVQCTMSMCKISSVLLIWPFFFSPFLSKMFIWCIASNKKPLKIQNEERKLKITTLEAVAIIVVVFGNYLSLSWKYRTKRTK